MAFVWKELLPVLFAPYTTTARDALSDIPSEIIIQNTTTGRVNIITSNEQWQDFLTYNGTATSDEIVAWNSTEEYWEPLSTSEYFAKLVDDAASDPLIDADSAADGTEDSPARKDHVHLKHHATAHVLATSGPHTSQLPISDIEDMAKIGSPTFATIQDLQNVFHSAGWVSGGIISDAGSANIDIALGAGLIRSSTSGTAELLYFDWSVSTGNAIPTNTVRYIGIEYNAGSPQVVIKTSNSWTFTTEFPLGLVINEADTLHIFQANFEIGDHASQMIQRMLATSPLQRDKKAGGIILGESGTNKITLTAGTLWEGLTKFAISALDTNVSGNFDRYYRKVGDSGWNKESAQTDWPNAKYDDNSGTLADMTGNKYAVLWFYVESDGHVVMLYGRNEYATAALAEEEPLSPTLPDRLTEQGVLISRLVYQRNDTSADSISSVFTTVFDRVGVTAHSDLSGIGVNDHHTKYTDTDAVTAIETEDPLDLAGVVNFAKNINLTRGTSDNIDGNDEIAVPSVSWLYLTSAGATDNLDGIGAGTEGQLVFLTVVAGKDITLVHDGTVTAGKKLMINGEANVTLDEDHDIAIAVYDATATVWNVMVPGSGGGANHDILDGSVHQDSVADGVTKGSIIIGNATPKWDELIVGTDGYVLTSQADGTVAWEAASGGSGTFHYSITVENPDASEDISISFTQAAITITEMRAVLIGSATPSVSWKIRHQADRNNAGNAVVTAGTTTTSTTTGSDVTAFDDATIGADSFIWFETTAQSGTVTEIHITIIGTVD